VTADRAQITGLREDANVETVAGKRLNEGGPSTVLDRGESQIVSFMKPTLA
jgi:hypothetical protein